MRSGGPSTAPAPYPVAGVAVGKTRATLVECHDIAFVAVQIKGQGTGEVAPEQAVHEKLAHLAHAGEHPLRAGHDHPFLPRHTPQDGGERLLRAGLVKPEIHEVEGVDDALHLQGPCFAGREPHQFLGPGQQREDVAVREGQFQLGVTVEEPLELGVVIPIAQAAVVAPAPR